MKKLLFLIVSLFFGFQSNAINIPALYKSIEKKVSRYGHDLLVDTSTQISTLFTGAVIVGGYTYYLNQLARVCLDGHPNSQIMYTSNLYMTYLHFLQLIESMNSYEDVMSFINIYCIDYSGSIDLDKVNRLIALVNDLQTNNNRRTDIFNRNEENGNLNTFKQLLQVARSNYKEQLTYDEMVASKNAKNFYTLSKCIEIVAYIFNAFNAK